MLHSSIPTGATANSEFKNVVDNLLLSVSNFDRAELRSANRESLVVPVRVTFVESDCGLQMPGFTRNISLTGVGLLLPASCEEEVSALIDMERADGRCKYRVLAECRWIKSFGESWYLSGWQFTEVHGRV